MKNILLLLFIITMFSSSASSQVSALGNDIIEKNDFDYAKAILLRYNFTFYSDEEVTALGNNSRIRAIGTKGTNPSNSIMAVIDAVSLQNSGIKMATFICCKAYAMYIENDLFEVGYEKADEREYLEDGKFKVIEKTYKRSTENITDTVIAKFTMQGDAQVTFKRSKNKKAK